MRCLQTCFDFHLIFVWFHSSTFKPVDQSMKQGFVRWVVISFFFSQSMLCSCSLSVLVPTSVESVRLCTSFRFILGLHIKRYLLGSLSCFCFLSGSPVKGKTSISPSSQSSKGFSEKSLHSRSLTWPTMHAVDSRFKGEIICSLPEWGKYWCSWGSRKRKEMKRKEKNKKLIGTW